MTEDPRSDALADALLRALPAPPDGAGPHPDDGVLLQLRRGQLDATRAAAVDAHLAACRDCRDLLRELARAGPPLAVPLPVAQPGPRAARDPWRAAHRIATAAAGVAALAAGLLLGLGPSRPPPAHEYEIRTLRGIAELRGQGALEPPRSGIDVDADTRVLVVLAPKTDQTEAPSFAAFVAQGDGPLAAVPEGALAIGEGGAVKIEAKARQLFGTSAGTFALYGVVAAPGVQLGAIAGRGAREARRETPEAQWITIEIRSRGEVTP